VSEEGDIAAFANYSADEASSGAAPVVSLKFFLVFIF